MNNDSFLIEESDLELARDICKDIDDSQIRNRAMANALASDVAKKYFKEIEIDTESGLHKISGVLEELDIADIYLNGSYVDVRVYFNDNELCVPKSHFENGLLPVAYMFIKLDAELSGGLVTGFILPSSIDTSSSQSGYYLVKEEDLVSYYDVEPLFVMKDSSDIPEDFELVVFDYLDGKLSLNDKNAFYKVLLESAEYRKILKNASNTKNILSFVSIVKPETQEQIEDLGLEAALELNNDDLSLDLSSEVFDDLSEDTLDLLPEDSVNNLDSDFLEVSDDVLLEVNDNEELEIREGVIELGTVEEKENLLIEKDHAIDSAIDSDLSEEFDFVEEHISDNLLVNEDFVKNLEFVDQEDAAEDSIDSYSTNITPSLDTIENEIVSDFEEVLLNDEEERIEEPVKGADEFEDLLDVPEEEIVNQIVEEQAVDSEISTNEPEISNKEEHIDELFGEDLPSDDIDEEFVLPQKKKSSNLFPVIVLLAIIGVVGYFGYEKFVNQEFASNEIADSMPVNLPESKLLQESPSVQEAMPVETIENIKPIQTLEEGNAISIPAIEQNLNTSVDVSNLSVLWEVPAGYVSNVTAKRYFTKIGKIVQLNLKSELLLLNKTPITNKFGIELEFNKSSNKFVVKSVTISSGDKSVDDLIQKVVKNALDLNLKINMNVFSTIVGNPTLIIRL